jgi:hypothetical protein
MLVAHKHEAWFSMFGKDHRLAARGICNIADLLIEVTRRILAHESSPIGCPENLEFPDLQEIRRGARCGDVTDVLKIKKVAH